MAANIVPQKVEDVDTQALSPMMQQYLEIKRQHPNEILFYRVATLTRRWIKPPTCTEP